LYGYWSKGVSRHFYDYLSNQSSICLSLGDYFLWKS
jgi:hypothetical protein